MSVAPADRAALLEYLSRLTLGVLAGMPPAARAALLGPDLTTVPVDPIRDFERRHPGAIERIIRGPRKR